MDETQMNQSEGATLSQRMDEAAKQRSADGQEIRRMAGVDLHATEQVPENYIVYFYDAQQSLDARCKAFGPGTFEQAKAELDQLSTAAPQASGMVLQLKAFAS